jgi:hypothetical protein
MGNSVPRWFQGKMGRDAAGLAACRWRPFRPRGAGRDHRPEGLCFARAGFQPGGVGGIGPMRESGAARRMGCSVLRGRAFSPGGVGRIGPIGPMRESGAARRMEGSVLRGRAFSPGGVGGIGPIGPIGPMRESGAARRMERSVLRGRAFSPGGVGRIGPMGPIGPMRESGAAHNSRVSWKPEFLEHAYVPFE